MFTSLLILCQEHLGLIRPQWCKENEEVTSFMRPAPHANDDEIGTQQDDMVADPLSDETDRLWNDTARSNREIFTECFRPVPTNLIRSWASYEVCFFFHEYHWFPLLMERWKQNYVPKVQTDHAVPEITLERLKDRLSKVRGALVECPLVSFMH